MGVSQVPYDRAASTMQFCILSEASIQNLNLLSQKLWFLWLRVVLGLFLEPQGRHMGVSQVPYAQVASTMRLLFLQEALIQNFNLLSKKLQVLWLRAVLGQFLGPSGVAHGGVLGLLWSGSLHHAVSFPFRGLDTKFELSISKTLVFTLQGCAWDPYGAVGAKQNKILHRFFF